MRVINTLLLFILVFFTGTVCPMIGIANGNTLHLMVIVMLCFFNANRIFKTFYTDKCLRGGLYFFFFMLIVTFVLSRGDVVGTVGWLTIPFNCAIVLSLDKKTLKGMQIVLLVFFVAECLLAIYERKYNIALFPYTEDDYYLSMVDKGESWQFRSSSLLGNPLFNANFVSFALCLLLCCDNIKVIFRYLLALLGLFAILGFNARAATIVTSCLVLYKLYMILRGQQSKINKCLLYALIVISLYYAADFVINSDWGGRLIQDELMDGSAQARLSFYDYFEHISVISFPAWVSKINKSENSYLFILISYGIVLGSLLIFTLLKLFFHFLSPYSAQVKLLLLISAIGVGSMNNNLAGPGLFSWFFMYLLAFRNELTFKTLSNEGVMVK